MKLIVLAAGFATRLYPVTRDTAKALLDIGGKPMLSRLLDLMLGLEAIDGVVIVVNDRFAEPFEAWRKGYASRVSIRVVNDGARSEENKLGAVADMALGMQSVEHDEEMLVVAGDNLLEFDLEGAYREFKRRGRPMLLVREVADPKAMARYNEVTLDAEGNVTGFTEKPKAARGNLASLCVYFFTPEVRGEVELYLNSGGNADAPGYFIERLVRRLQVTARAFRGRSFDIGNPETLEDARAEFARRA